MIVVFVCGCWFVWLLFLFVVVDLGLFVVVGLIWLVFFVLIVVLC